MLTQRVIKNADGTATLVVTAEPVSVPELIALAEELGLRSTVRTDGTIHILNETDGTTPSIRIE